jgi:UDP-N-acetylglucosamine 3-dehydrogenase
MLEFDGTTANIEVNWFTPHKIRTLVATGSEGIAYLDYIKQSVTVFDSHNNEIVNILEGEPLKLELQDFIDSIVTRRKPTVDGLDGLAILKIALDACK